MQYFQHKKAPLIALTILATIGFSINSFFDNSSNNAINTIEESTSRPQQHASQTEHLNLTERSKPKTPKGTDTNQDKIANTSQANTPVRSRAEALAKEEELAKAQKCLESNLDEVGYITEAYNQNTLDAATAQQQIIHYMETCNRKQVASMINKIFEDSDSAVHSMSLLLEILPNMQRNLSIINAIKQQTFSHEEMQQLIAMTADQPTGVKQALVPSIVRNDNLDDFLSLTQQDSFFNSMEQRTGSYPTADEASSMIQSLILSERHNIQPEGEIYNHILETYPNSATYNQLIKIALTSNQN